MMKIKFVSFDNLDTIKTNLGTWQNLFKLDSGEALVSEFDGNLFSDTKYDEIADIRLDMSEEKPFLTEAKNSQKIYDGLRFLSDSQASDERLWAGLCLGPFWEYVQYRWDIKKKCTPSNITQHYLFGYGARRSLTRNAIARLWWIARLTYDENRSDPYELTKFVCENPDFIMHILERNTSNNPMLTRALLDAMLDARKEGLVINTDVGGELAKYLNLLGGIYILDCLPEKKVHDKLLDKARELSERSKDNQDIEVTP